MFQLKAFIRTKYSYIHEALLYMHCLLLFKFVLQQYHHKHLLELRGNFPAPTSRSINEVSVLYPLSFCSSVLEFSLLFYICPKVPHVPAFVQSFQYLFVFINYLVMMFNSLVGWHDGSSFQLQHIGEGMFLSFISYIHYSSWYNRLLVLSFWVLDFHRLKYMGRSTCVAQGILS